MVSLSRSADAPYHGDQAATPGKLDVAVNVRAASPPKWQVKPLDDLGSYPSGSEHRPATAAVREVTR